MFLKKIRDYKDKLTVRLTFMYALLFIISSFLVLLIFYLQVSSITMKPTDAELSEEVDELSTGMGVSELRSKLAEEVESESVQWWNWIGFKPC